MPTTPVTIELGGRDEQVILLIQDGTIILTLQYVFRNASGQITNWFFEELALTTDKASKLLRVVRDLKSRGSGEKRVFIFRHRFYVSYEPQTNPESPWKLSLRGKSVNLSQADVDKLVAFVQNHTGLKII